MHHIFPFRLQRAKHLLYIQTPKQSEGGLVFKIDFLTIVRIFNFFPLGKPSKKNNKRLTLRSCEGKNALFIML